MRKYEEGTFPLIRPHFRQSVKPWPRATSHQEVGHGTTRKQRMPMVSNDALHHPDRLRRGDGPGWAGAGHQEERPCWLSPSHKRGRESVRGTHPSTRASQRPRGCCLPTPMPLLEDGGLRTPGHARGVPSTQPLGKDPAAPGGRPVGPVLRHRLHTPLGRRERWNHSPNMQKRREDSFLSGKQGQEGSLGFLCRPKLVPRLLGCLIRQACGGARALLVSRNCEFPKGRPTWPWPWPWPREKGNRARPAPGKDSGPPTCDSGFSPLLTVCRQAGP